MYIYTLNTNTYTYTWLSHVVTATGPYKYMRSYMNVFFLMRAKTTEQGQSDNLKKSERRL